MVVDVTTGVTEEDLAAAKVIRRSGAPVRLVVNKVDDGAREAAAWEFVSLGLGDPFPVSALHGRGTGDLLDEVVGLFPAAERRRRRRPRRAWSAWRPAATRGRAARARHAPGGHHRAAQRGQVDALQPAARRGALDRARPAGHDTRRHRHRGGDAGRPDLLHRHRRPAPPVEDRPRHRAARHAAGPARASSGPTSPSSSSTPPSGASHQDQRLAERIGVSGCPAIVALNKWDQVATDDRDDVLAGVGDRLAFLGAAPVLKISALSGKGVHRILPALRDAVEAYHQRVPTGALNRACRTCRAASPRRGRASATPCRARSTRRRSRCSPAGACRRRTCATSSAGSARSSTSARRR